MRAERQILMFELDGNLVRHFERAEVINNPDGSITFREGSSLGGLADWYDPSNPRRSK